jgi:hypothetical protein
MTGTISHFVSYDGTPIKRGYRYRVAYLIEFAEAPSYRQPERLLRGTSGV